MQRPHFGYQPMHVMLWSRVKSGKL